ncbi:MAG: dTMP kinase [Anaerolineae bacterium]|nr:dTMP kinase [Anaerolineae bacterium]
MTQFAMIANPGPGKLIVLEGLDGAGTTTQAQCLGDYLRERVRAVTITCEPTDGPAGRLIRRILTHQDTIHPRALAALFVADRLDHLYGDRGIAAQLQAGVWVVMDRYYLSSLAYQSLPLAEHEVPWLYDMHAPCIAPDVTFFLDVPAAVCLERIRKNRGGAFDLFEKEELLTAVAARYHAAIQALQTRETIQIVDGTQDKTSVTGAIQAYLEATFLRGIRILPLP